MTHLQIQKRSGDLTFTAPYFFIKQGNLYKLHFRNQSFCSGSLNIHKFNRAPYRCS